MAPDDLIPIFIMGKKYLVPATLTILKALEYSGYKMIRGCGCRGGVCGACPTVYRTAGDYKLKVGLACQTVVQPGMYLAQIPFYPANKAKYDIEKLAPTAEAILGMYPELLKCMGCDSCTRVCPQDLKTMEYMSAAMRGDIERAARLSFECIMCGLCASKCPTDNVQYNVSILARRLYARHIAPADKGLAARVGRIESGAFDKELDDLLDADDETIRAEYQKAQHDREAD